METPAKAVRRGRAKKAAAADAPSLPDGLAGPSPEAAAAEPAATVPAVTAPAVSEPAGDAAAEQKRAPAKRAPRRRATAPVTAPMFIPSAGAEQGELSLDHPAAGNEAAVAAGDAAATAAPAAEPSGPARKAPARRSRAKAATVAAPADEAPAAPGHQATGHETAGHETAAGEATTTARTTRSRRTPAARKSASPAAPETDVGAPDSATAADSGTAASPASVDTTEAATHAEAVMSGVGPAQDATSPATDTPSAGGSLFLAPAAGMSALFLAPDLSHPLPVPAAARAAGDDQESGDADGPEESSGNHRGRGRNRNRRNKPAETNEEAADAAPTEESESESDGVTSRRRRRRRRGDADLELTGGTEEDPPNTVTKVRAPRTPVESSQSASNRVTSLRGSTRLEAKKQRRRDSRDSGRRRTVITEAEFLARRESVDRVMVVRQSDDRIQIGVLEDGILAEHFVSKTQQDSLIGNVYLGKVQNVLPSMEAAFVDIGRGRNAVLYAGEVDWDGANLNGQPRRIENALKSGDSVLVQVSKDPVGHKGARLTSQISLPGRYLVYVPGGSMTGISRKLPDVERNRLKRVLKDHLPDNAGVIVRTAAEGASEEELTNDINRLRAQWEGINNRATSHKMLAPEMLYGEPDLTIKVVRDVFNEDFTKLIVSGEEAWDTIEAYVTYVAPDLLDRLEKWTTPEDIFGAHRIDEQISKALERKVFLPSGGSLVIDRTEAMTVVDVNTGKFTGSGGNLEETVTKNNLEAAEEVVRQLRLRDIGGIIVIDFIDMVLESNRDLVLRRMVECLGRDRTKHQVAEVTSLGLVQMTRKRMGTGLLEVFGEQCEACAGRGMVTHEIPVEHRRVHAVAAEQHHPQVGRNDQHDGERTANRSTRSERKRNRNRSQYADADHADAYESGEAHAAVVVDEASEAERMHKATQARAALASIAAAAAAAHHDTGAGAPVEAGEVQSLPTSLGDTATVTLGGEAVALPRGNHNDDAARQGGQAAALAGLAQALDQLAGPLDAAKQDAGPLDAAKQDAGQQDAGQQDAGQQDAGQQDAGQQDAGAGEGHHDSASVSRGRSRKARRHRSARSAQGGADTSVETSETGAGQGGAQHSSAAAVRPAAVNTVGAVAKKEAAPIIMFGVGVPASEL